MRRRIVAILLAGMMTTCAACGNQTSDETNKKDTVSTEEYDTSTQQETTTEEKDVENTEETSSFPYELKSDVEVEAGVLEVPSDIVYQSVPDGKAIIKTGLSMDQLKVYGSEHQMEVEYDGCVYIVTVHIVDTTAPQIEGLADITAYVNGSVSFKKNIVITDNSDSECTIEVDNSKVDMSKEGDYPVHYVVKDAAGNETSADITLHVIPAPVIDETYMKPYIDKILAEVITDGMSKWEQAYALWNWCKSHISYVSAGGDRTDEWHGAYEGIVRRYGDCYAYYASYKVLLDAVGIENIKVARINGKTNHWWNLVKVSKNGWYHCDTSPRRNGDGYQCFMQTDEQVYAYTETYPEHPNYYIFDESLYPERGTVEVFNGGIVFQMETTAPTEAITTEVVTEEQTTKKVTEETTKNKKKKQKAEKSEETTEKETKKKSKKKS